MEKKLRDLREIMSEEMIMKDKIIEVLRINGPMTIPEIAKAINKPTDEVLLWVMAMRKYGTIVETEEITDDDYYKYELAKKED